MSKAFCEPDRIRTYDRLLRREVLYPAELRARNSNFVGVAGFEPATSASQTRRDNRATLHPETIIKKKRRDGDSNPGYPVRVRLFSKQVLSATQAPLLFIFLRTLH